ncbi:hypothetical protein AB833_08245 [Chromatiales bacterium (ex Bugula neritina AB1)]|nr:hypothetical protein AB833_08245 [Chromatiales bacterium (ex Bugula neritina AB1)]
MQKIYNVIVNDGTATATIMGFEEACFYYRVFDIGMMLVGFCRVSDKLNLVAAEKLLAGISRYLNCMRAKNTHCRALRSTRQLQLRIGDTNIIVTQCLT